MSPPTPSDVVDVDARAGHERYRWAACLLVEGESQREERVDAGAEIIETFAGRHAGGVTPISWTHSGFRHLSRGERLPAVVKSCPKAMGKVVAEGRCAPPRRRSARTRVRWSGRGHRRSVHVERHHRPRCVADDNGRKRMLHVVRGSSRMPQLLERAMEMDGVGN